VVPFLAAALFLMQLPRPQQQIPEPRYQLHIPEIEDNRPQLLRSVASVEFPGWVNACNAWAKEWDPRITSARDLRLYKECRKKFKELDAMMRQLGYGK
jgi:hypothetical protein